MPDLACDFVAPSPHEDVKETDSFHEPNERGLGADPWAAWWLGNLGDGVSGFQVPGASWVAQILWNYIWVSYRLQACQCSSCTKGMWISKTWFLYLYFAIACTRAWLLEWRGILAQAFVSMCGAAFFLKPISMCYIAITNIYSHYLSPFIIVYQYLSAFHSDAMSWIWYLWGISSIISL